MTINADSTVQILAEEAHPLDRFDPQVRNCSLIYVYVRTNWKIFSDILGFPVHVIVYRGIKRGRAI